MAESLDRSARPARPKAVTAATILLWLAALLALMLGLSLLTRSVLTGVTAPTQSTSAESGIGLLLIVAGIILGALAVLIGHGNALGRTLLVLLVLIMTGLNVAAIRVGINEQDMMGEGGIVLTALALLLVLVPKASRAFFAQEPSGEPTLADALDA